MCTFQLGDNGFFFYLLKTGRIQLCLVNDFNGNLSRKSKRKTINPVATTPKDSRIGKPVNGPPMTNVFLRMHSCNSRVCKALPLGELRGLVGVSIQFASVPLVCCLIKFSLQHSKHSISSSISLLLSGH